MENTFSFYLFSIDRFFTPPHSPQPAKRRNVFFAFAFRRLGFIIFARTRNSRVAHSEGAVHGKGRIDLSLVKFYLLYNFRSLQSRDKEGEVESSGRGNFSIENKIPRSTAEEKITFGGGNAIRVSLVDITRLFSRYQQVEWRTHAGKKNKWKSDRKAGLMTQSVTLYQPKLCLLRNFSAAFSCLKTQIGAF